VLDGPSACKNNPAKFDQGCKDMWAVLDLVDVVFVVIFTIEMVLKMVAFGLYPESDQTYFKNPWNILDFFLVVFALVGYAPGTGNLKIFRTLRSLRALRPLRTIQRAPGLKIVVDVCFMCAPTFINICFVVFFFFLCFPSSASSSSRGSSGRAATETLRSLPTATAPAASGSTTR